MVLLCRPPPILLTITKDAGGVRSACRTAGTHRVADVVERSIPWCQASLSDRHACRFRWSSEWRAPTTATPYGCPVLLAGCIVHVWRSTCPSSRIHGVDTLALRIERPVQLPATPNDCN